jgi:hypothetical protein
MTMRRAARVGLALAVLALALPASASAQATRTFVSGVGNDANPCSRTAPCRTWSGAQTKTAAGGIMMAIDDGAYGTISITKPLTLDGGRHQIGMLSSGGINGVNVNIDPAFQPANFVNNGRVVLKNIKIEGNAAIPPAGAFTPGLNGVRVLHAKTVKLFNVDIGFFSRSGVLVEPAASTVTKVVVSRSDIHDNGGVGVVAAPANAAVARVTVRNSDIDDNGCGLVATQSGMSNAFATNCGTNAPAASAGTAILAAFDNGIVDSASSAVLSNGSATAARISGNKITGSGGPALNALNTGAILSWQDNKIAANPGGNGASTGTIGDL